jgi:NTP pyrophosphatase (non-canonical NTP hydrolase)
MADEKFSNCLNDSEAERLAILVEELGEALQAAGKILRYGYESYDPTLDDADIRTSEGQNRRDLEKELGDIRWIVALMEQRSDLHESAILRRAVEKAAKVKPYLHHQ